MEITIYDCETGETTVRPMNDTELVAYEARIAKAAEEAKQAEALAEKRKAALLKLEALGIDIDDLKALGLG
jgi:hypothetical protein